MPEQPANKHHHPNPSEIVRGVRMWFLLRHRWFRHLRRWQRWTVRLAIGVPLLVLVALLVVARSPLTRSLVIPELERATNLSIDADAVFVRADGRLVMDGVRFRIPTVAGPAGLVLQVERLSAAVDWGSLISGPARVREVSLIGPVLRISQSVADGWPNVAAIKPPAAPPGGGSGMVLPRVLARDGSIEFGEHAGGRFTLLKRLPVEGRLTPAPRGQAGYAVGLTEFRREQGGAMKPGFEIHGRLDQDSVAVDMDNFSLDDWPPQTVPSKVRKLFTDLGLSGKVGRASFSFSEAAGVAAELILDGVELNLPIEPDRPAPAGSERFMRMRGVKGTATFRQDSVLVKAEGVLEDLPYTVELLYEGTSADSPFHCRITSHGFEVERYPKLLPYAPPIVAKRLATFSGPTATVNTRLDLRRGPPTPEGPGPITFQGEMDISNGTAAFDKFPYTFENMCARVYFDNDKLEVRDVRGTAPSGATLVARADVAPVNEDAEIKVWVEVTGAPIDEAMERAFGPGRERVVHALFNRDKYRRLLDSGLVLSPAHASQLRSELEGARADLSLRPDGAAAEEVRGRIGELEEALAHPVFEFGGVADISVYVHRPLGDKVEWESDVEVRLGRAGLLPDAFPLPVHARGVVCRIRDQDAVISGGTYGGLRGGTADVGGSFRIPPSRDPAADPRPDVTIDVRDMPLDDLAIHALPGEDTSALKRSLRGLRIGGTAEGRVHIAPMDVLGRAGPGDKTGFDADLRITGAHAAPGAHGPDGAIVCDAAGTLRVTERTMALALDATTAGDVGAGTPVRIETDARFEFKREGTAPASPPEIRTTIRATGADARTPVERVVRVFSEQAADQIVRLRGIHNPSGAADVHASILVEGNATRSVRLNVTGVRRAEFDWLGGRISLSESSGAVEVECVGGVAAQFQSLAGPMNFEGRPVGDVRLDGWHRFARPQAHAAVQGPALPGDGGVLHVSAEGGRFESPFVTAVLERPVGRDRLAAFERLNPRGEFGAEVDLRGGGGGEPLRVAGTITPVTFTCDLEGVEVAFERCSGSLSFAGSEGTFERLSGDAADWSVTLDGGWKPAEGGVLLDTAIAARGSHLAPDARIFLPAALRAALDDIQLHVDGPFSLSNSRLTMLAGVEPARAWSRFEGSAGFDSVSLVAGAVITRCDGRLNARYEQSAGAPPAYRVGVIADRLQVAGADAHNARCIVQNGTAPGELVVPLLTGECHGGRFAGRVLVSRAGAAEREYASSIQLSGVDFGLLMHDLKTRAAERDGTAPGPPPQPGSRGRIDAELSMAGFIRAPEMRRGRGMLRISGDQVRVINLPGVVPLIEVSNLALPANAALDYAEAEFYVDGGVVSFDTISVLSKAIEIVGYGTMAWPSQELDLRFNSRSARPIPMISWLLQGIRKQLVATSVRGTPRKPEVRIISMPGTRRMLGRVIGAEGTDRSRRLLELERRSTLSRHGIRPTARSIPGSVSAAASDDP